MLLDTSLKQITFYATYIDMCNYVAFANRLPFYPHIIPSWVKTIPLKLHTFYIHRVAPKEDKVSMYFVVLVVGC